MKTYAPRSLRSADLRGLLDDLGASPAQVARFLDVSERTMWRWLRDDSAPFAVLAALWHETPTGRQVTALDVGNELALMRHAARLESERADRLQARLEKLLILAQGHGWTGSANDAVQLEAPRLVAR